MASPAQTMQGAWWRYFRCFSFSRQSSNLELLSGSQRPLISSPQQLPRAQPERLDQSEGLGVLLASILAPLNASLVEES
jgi:hypothetical protein